MFTGLIQTTGVLAGRICRQHAGKLSVRPKHSFSDLEFGESIAVNGVCLTLEAHDPDGTLHFHTLAETLDRSNLGQLPLGGMVNLERALRPIDRLGGHIVTGHVDTTGEVLHLRLLSEGDWELAVTLPPEYDLLVVPKGSIAIDGISLTVASVEAGRFTVRLIPVTLAETALETRKPGAPVNLETDLLGKYVQRQLLGSGLGSKSSITMETLLNAGFL